MNQATTQQSCSDSDSDLSDRRDSGSGHQRQVSSTRQTRAQYYIGRRRRESLLRDEDSSGLYFSEPSGTENGDDSTGAMLYNSSSAAIQDNRFRFSQRRRREAQIPSSPGNTSLSSRETPSPAEARNVVVQFAPDRQEAPRSFLSAPLDDRRRGVQTSERSGGYSRDGMQSGSVDSRQGHSGQQFALNLTPTDQQVPFTSQSFQQSNQSPSAHVNGTQQSQRLFRRSRTEQEQKLGDNTTTNLTVPARGGSTYQTIGLSDDAFSSSLVGNTRTGSAGEADAPMDNSIAMTLSDDSEPQEAAQTFSTSLSSPSLQSSKRRALPTASGQKRSRRRGTVNEAIDFVYMNDLAVPRFSIPRGTALNARLYDSSSSMPMDIPLIGPVTGPSGVPTSQWLGPSSDFDHPSRRRRPYSSSSVVNANNQRQPTHRPDLLKEEGSMYLDAHENFDQKTHVYRDGKEDDIEQARQPDVVSYPEQNPFENITKGSAEKASRQFLPQSSVVDDEGSKYRFFTCPRCKTRQREFITVSSAPNQDSGPSGYLALYFALYVTSSLFIFGLEEGWKPLDCIYFAVITLTTCGLGDFVPTTPGNKLICSFFIYFGVACIGLLLGTYIAGILDDKASRDRKSKQMESCQNCKHLQNIKDAASGRFGDVRAVGQRRGIVRSSSESHDISSHEVQRSRGNGNTPTAGSSRIHRQSFLLDRSVPGTEAAPNGSVPDNSAIPAQSQYLLSPVTRRILGRQGHTRHVSIDLTSAPIPRLRRDNFSKLNSQIVSETSPLNPPTLSSSFIAKREDDATSDDDSESSDSESETSESSASTKFDIMDDNTFRIRAAKYVILTIRQALLNSIVIIALGCFGFWFIEGFAVIDSWYFTTVLLTTTGYGDITPYTKGGKLFATVYILVAGTILLNNMSMISIIPLELRRRRIERAVLTQFGDELDDEALRELATGPTVQRLHLAASRPDGLDECTREMFSLAMLVRLGKVTEEDIKETFAAFRRLDVNDEGVLNSKSIIAAMIHRRRSRNDVSTKETSPKPPKSTSAPSLLQVEASQRMSSLRDFIGDDDAWAHSVGFY